MIYVGYETLSMLTDMIVRYKANGYGAYGFYFPYELMECFEIADEEMTFELLEHLNVSALMEEYEDWEDRIEHKGYDTKYDIWKPRTLKSPVKDWHYQFLKSLNFFVYNCSGEKTSNTILYKGMKDLANNVAQFIACNSKKYEDAEWQIADKDSTIRINIKFK